MCRFSSISLKERKIEYLTLLTGYTAVSRKFLSTNTNSFYFLLEQAKKPYLDFLKASNLKKTNLLTLQRVVWELNPQSQSTINTLDDAELEDRWNELKDKLAQSEEPLPAYAKINSDDAFKEQINVRNVHNRKLRELSLHQNSVETSPHVAEFLQTQEFKYWFLNPPGVPFTRKEERVNAKEIILKRQYIIDQLSKTTAELFPLLTNNSQDAEIMEELLASAEEDAFALYLLLLPYLNSNTVIHEIGAWNGQNLLNIVMYAHLKNRTLAGCIGTDINPTALSFARTMAKGLGLERYVKFGWAHGLLPLDINNFVEPHKEKVKIAIRFIPVLDKNSIDLYLEQAKNTLEQNDILGLTYAMKDGKLYSSNLAKAINTEEGYSSVEFEEGITIFKPLVPEYNTKTGKVDYRLAVLNTYFSEAGFKALMKKYDLEVIQHVIVGKNSENNRGVCLLRKGKSI